MHSLDEKLMLHDKVMQKLEEEVSQRVILDRKVDDIASVPVSYTHLTLPTIYSV